MVLETTFPETTFRDANSCEWSCQLACCQDGGTLSVTGYACRSMIAQLEDSTELVLSEDSSTFAMLLEALFVLGLKQPPITKHTIHTYAELARKYDIPNLALFCDIFVSTVPLTLHSLPKWHALADTYNMSAAKTHCRYFAAGSNFKKIHRQVTTGTVPFSLDAIMCMSFEVLLLNLQPR